MNLKKISLPVQMQYIPYIVQVPTHLFNSTMVKMQDCSLPQLVDMQEKSK